MRLRSTVLVVAGAIVAASIWLQARRGTSDDPPAIAQEVPQAQSPRTPTPGPIAMEREFLRGRPAQVPEVDLADVEHLSEPGRRTLASVAIQW